MTGYVAMLRSQGAIVYWVALPKMREAAYDADVVRMNAFYRQLMGKLGVAFIETAPYSVDGEGHYAAYLPDPATGKPQLMRANDGIHMSMNGYIPDHPRTSRAHQELCRSGARAGGQWRTAATCGGAGRRRSAAACDRATEAGDQGDAATGGSARRRADITTRRHKTGAGGASAAAGEGRPPPIYFHPNYRVMPMRPRMLNEADGSLSGGVVRRDGRDAIRSGTGEFTICDRRLRGIAVRLFGSQILF